MGKKEEIELFYKTVEDLDLRFPVADIARKTGESKGNVSKILARKLEPSESFIQRFQESYKNVSRETAHGTFVPAIAVLGTQGVNVTLQDYLDLKDELIRTLKEDKEKLYGIINSGLIRSTDDLDTILAYQKAWVDYTAEKDSGGDKKKKAQVHLKMNKLVDDRKKGRASADIHGDTGT